MVILNRDGLANSLQISHLEQASVKVYDTPVLIKNNSGDDVELTVKCWKDSSSIATTFAPGWNPEIISEIVSGDITNIQIGY